ncbi:MAG: hypothetical protein ACR2NU_15170 [Aeoliella sp.]
MSAFLRRWLWSGIVRADTHTFLRHRQVVFVTGCWRAAVDPLPPKSIHTIIMLRFDSSSRAGSVDVTNVASSDFYVLMLLAATGCTGNSMHVELPDLDPGKVAASALESLDQNGDGAIAGEELDQCPSLKSSAGGIDQNGDRRLTAEEIEARLRKYLDDQIGVQSLICFVSLDDRPLVGAEIVLQPESFLEEAIQPALGTTAEDGAAVMMTDDGKLPGVQPGFYRVRISKVIGGKEQIPAVYITSSELGHEVSFFSAAANARFELTSR